MNVNPSYRMQTICSSIFPSILDNYKEGGWNAEESLDILDKYYLKGVELSETFDDNVEALDSLDTCYGKVKDLIEVEQIERMLSGEKETPPDV